MVFYFATYLKQKQIIKIETKRTVVLRINKLSFCGKG